MGSYWGGDGAHQAAYFELHRELVPRWGCCDTVEGELLRAAGQILHEACNNGWDNNRSGAANYLKRFGDLDAETVAYLDENANIDRGGYVDMDLLDRMMDAVVVRARDTHPRTANTVDLEDLSDPPGVAEVDEDEDYDEDDVHG